MATHAAESRKPMNKGAIVWSNSCAGLPARGSSGICLVCLGADIGCDRTSQNKLKRVGVLTATCNDFRYIKHFTRDSMAPATVSCLMTTPRMPPDRN